MQRNLSVEERVRTTAVRCIPASGDAPSLAGQRSIRGWASEHGPVRVRPRQCSFAGKLRSGKPLIGTLREVRESAATALPCC